MLWPDPDVRALMARVRDRILAEPSQFAMDMVFSDQEDISADVDSDSDSDLPREIRGCGTAACIGGWILCERDGLSPQDCLLQSASWAWCGSSRLGVARTHAHLTEAQAERLFHLVRWPIPLRQGWNREQSLEGRARIAADLIDDLLAGRRDITLDGDWR